MTVIRRRAAERPPESRPEPRLGVACQHCLSALGEVWTNGKVRLPSASFVREDGQLETRCAHCGRYTTLPYRRTA